MNNGSVVSTTLAASNRSGPDQAPAIRSWPAEIADSLLEHGVDVTAFVPDSRLEGILSRLRERDTALRSLTREEECVSYAAGRRLAGDKPVLLMQCSGLGNALNALSTLAVQYRLGLPLVISMRGTLGEANSSQVPMGRATKPFLEALGIQHFSVREPEHAKRVTEGVLSLAFNAGETAAVLLEPELGGGRGRR